MFGPLRKTFFALFVSTSYKVNYLLCGQPYTSTLIEMRSFHVCGLNLRYLASNTLTSLRTTVIWSVLPVRVCKIKMIMLGERLTAFNADNSSHICVCTWTRHWRSRRPPFNVFSNTSISYS